MESVKPQIWQKDPRAMAAIRGHLDTENLVPTLTTDPSPNAKHWTRMSGSFTAMGGSEQGWAKDI